MFKHAAHRIVLKMTGSRVKGLWMDEKLHTRYLHACKFNSTSFLTHWQFAFSPPVINYPSPVNQISALLTSYIVRLFQTHTFLHGCCLHVNKWWTAVTFHLSLYTKRPFRNQLLLKMGCRVYTPPPPQPSVCLELGKMIDFKSAYTGLLSCDLLTGVGNLMFCWLTSQLVTSGYTPKWSDV